MDVEKIIQDFINNISLIESDIYNEFSLQHELGIFFRQKLPDYKVQFERNVSFFNSCEKDNFIKKEIDIVIYKEDFSEKYAVELKYPKNGQYPETMFSFIKDICFMEQVKQNLHFDNTFVLTMVTDKNYYEGSYPSEIYKYFRGKTEKIPSKIQKPTGKKDEIVTLDGTYSVKWKPTTSKFTYYIIKT